MYELYGLWYAKEQAKVSTQKTIIQTAYSSLRYKPKPDGLGLAQTKLSRFCPYLEPKWSGWPYVFENFIFTL